MATDTAEMYARFADIEARGVSPTYEHLASSIAGDDVLLQLISRLPRAKQQPNLVLGAARLLGAPTDSFAAYRRRPERHGRRTSGFAGAMA